MTIAERLQKAIDEGRRVRVRFDDGLVLIGRPLALIDEVVVLKGPFAFPYPLDEIVAVDLLAVSRRAA